MHTEFYSEKLQGMGHFGDLCVDKRVILILILYSVKMKTAFMLVRTVSSGKLL
jgi:hypothetical protein